MSDVSTNAMNPSGPGGPRRRSGAASWIFAIVLIAIASFVLFRPTPPAPVPPLFEAGERSLDAAVARAAETDRVVFAVATADWCGPCQTYKSSALADPRVAEWVSANAEPLYLDVDAAPEDAGRLGVRGIPATFLIRDGEVVASRSGVVGAGELLAWLDAETAPSP